MNLIDDSIMSEDAKDIKIEAKQFAEEYIEPNAKTYYEQAKYPQKIVNKAAQEDLLAQDISEEYGGRGFSLDQMLAMSEEFYKADAGIALSIQLASFGTKIIEKYGSEEQKESYLRPVAENQKISGLAVSEPESGSNLAGMQTKAEKDGDEWVLNGEKYWIGNGVEADWLTLYAKTAESDDRYSNYSLFIVPTDSNGYEAEHIPEKMSFRSSKQAHITLNNCRIPEDNIIGSEGAGFYMIAEYFNRGRIIVAGHGLGLAAAAIEEAVKFTDKREAFGKSVSDFQSVQHDIADMRIEFESARALCWRAQKKVQQNQNGGYWAALAKTKCTDTSVECAETSMKLHGGRSILKENKISRVYRDVRTPVIYEGANPIQKNLIFDQSG